MRGKRTTQTSTPKAASESALKQAAIEEQAQTSIEEQAQTSMPKAFGRGHELELEFNEICRELGGDLEGRREADEWLGTTGATYHGAPVSWAFTPKIFTTNEFAHLAEIAETMGTIMDKVTRRFLDDASFRASFALTPDIEYFCCMDAGYDQLIPLSRVDIFLNEETGDFWFCELNTDGSAGLNTTVEVTRAIQRTPTYAAFAKRHPNIKTVDVERLGCEALLRCYASWEKAGKDGHPVDMPTVVFVDYDESVSHGEVDSLIARFSEMGIPARFSDIRDLRMCVIHDGGHLRERLCDAVGPIDCVWRRAVTGEMFDKPCSGQGYLIDAASRKLVCLFGSLRTWPVHTKTVFAVLWSSAVEDVLSEDELAFVHAHVPETHLLAPESNLEAYNERQRWILKPADGYNAVGVLAGIDASDQEWDKALHKAACAGGVIQRYAPQYATPMIIGGRLVEGAGYTDLDAREADRQAQALNCASANNMEGLFLFNGHFSGVYTRCGYKATIGEWTNRFHMGCLVVDE